jgi:hypothetical protein
MILTSKQILDLSSSITTTTSDKHINHQLQSQTEMPKESRAG